MSKIAIDNNNVPVVANAPLSYAPQFANSLTAWKNSVLA